MAGEQTGLDGSRSALFFEAVRIIREMRQKTNDNYPKWAVWENVPGALSSRDGRDFQRVLESLVQIADESAVIPMPKDGKWSGAGEIMGENYSLAWRILDASKGWGVAQRRRRIYLVIDLRGERAGEVLFESEGVSRYTPPRGGAREGVAGGTEAGSDPPGRLVLNDMGGARMDVSVDESGTLRAQARNHPPVIVASGFCTEHSADSRGIGWAQEEAPTIRTGGKAGVAIEFNPTDSRVKLRGDGICQALCSRMGTGGNQVPLTFTQPTVYGISADQSRAMLSGNPRAGIYEAETSRTLDTGGGDPRRYQGGMAVVAPAYSVRPRVNTQIQEEQATTLQARDFKDAPLVGQPAYCMTVGIYGHAAEEKTPTLEARGYKDPPVVAKPDPPEYVVRRLTTLECCRLQGYPDGWTQNLESEEPNEAEIQRWTEIFAEWQRAQGRSVKAPSRNRVVKWLKNPTTDSAEYKAYGNSVTVPCAFFVLAGIAWAENESEN